jgi:hypothetical protein
MRSVRFASSPRPGQGEFCFITRGSDLFKSRVADNNNWSRLDTEFSHRKEWVRVGCAAPTSESQLLSESGTARPRSGTAGSRPVASVPVYFANWPTRACQNFLAPPVTGHSTNLSPTALAPRRGTRAAAKDHVDRLIASGLFPLFLLPPASLTAQTQCFPRSESPRGGWPSPGTLPLCARRRPGPMSLRVLLYVETLSTRSQSCDLLLVRLTH